MGKQVKGSVCIQVKNETTKMRADMATIFYSFINVTYTKVLNIGYLNRIGWGFFISDIGYRGRYRGYACISGVHIRHYI